MTPGKIADHSSTISPTTCKNGIESIVYID